MKTTPSRSRAILPFGNLWRAFRLLAGLQVVSLVTAAPPAPPAEGPAGWWKGNLHTHSLWSDGDEYPEMIADWYKRNGYHFVVLSDHNLLQEGARWLELKPPVYFAGRLQEKGGGGVLQRYLARFGPGWVEQRESAGKKEVRLKPLDEFRALFDEAGRFLLVPGYELTAQWGAEKGGPVHLTVVNARHVAEIKGADKALATIAQNLAAVKAQALQDGQTVYAHLNHPNFAWSITLDDLVASSGVRFMEIYNGHPLMHLTGDETHPGTERLWDLALTKRLRVSADDVLYALAVDDAHDYQESGALHGNTGRGWIMVRADFLTPEHLLKALEAGDFYASTGVVLTDVRRAEDRLRVAVAVEPGVDYTIQFIGTTGDAGAATGVVLAESKGPEAEYVLRGTELYVRARIISSKAQSNPVAPGDRETAWTQPLVSRRPVGISPPASGE